MLSEVVDRQRTAARNTAVRQELRIHMFKIRTSRAKLFIALAVLFGVGGIVVWYKLPDIVELYLWAGVELPQDRMPEHEASERRAGESAVFDGIEFVWCPPGSMTFDLPPPFLNVVEGTDQVVFSTDGFWLSKYEVTKAEWFLIMGTRPWRDEPRAPYSPNGVLNNVTRRSPKLDLEYLDYLRNARIHGAHAPRTPATTMTPNPDIDMFLSALNSPGNGSYRLPTPWEWEYAFSMADQSKVHGTNERKPWMLDSTFSPSFAYPVEKTVPNEWGFCGMDDNVSEVCSLPDVLVGSFSLKPRSLEDRFRSESLKDLVWEKGGSWRDIMEDISRQRFRQGASPRLDYNYAADDLGFRLLRELDR